MKILLVVCGHCWREFKTIAEEKQHTCEAKH